MWLFVFLTSKCNTTLGKSGMEQYDDCIEVQHFWSLEQWVDELLFFISTSSFYVWLPFFLSNVAGLWVCMWEIAAFRLGYSPPCSHVRKCSVSRCSFWNQVYGFLIGTIFFCKKQWLEPADKAFALRHRSQSS